MKKTRASNIELLRILAICGVVVLHYNNATMGGGLQYVAAGSVNQAVLLGLEGLFVCAVDLFVLITGYFSCTSQRRDPVKIIGLLMQVVAFRLVIHLYDALKKGTLSLGGVLTALLPVNYFVVLYVGLYLISPYINLALSKLSKGQLRKMVLLLVILLSVLPTAADLIEGIRGSMLMGLNPVSAYGDDSGYTLINFVLMYVIGAYIRLADIRVRKRYTVAAAAVFTAILAITGKYDPGTGIAWSYCNPIVIAQAVTIFLLFQQMEFSSKVVNELSKGAFTCFLVHNFFLGKFGIAEAVQRSPLFLVCHVLLTAIVLYLVSWVVYKIYDFVTQPVMKFADKLCKKMKLDFSVQEVP